MTDEDFLKLVEKEFKTSITKKQIPIYKKAILNCAKVLNVKEQKK